MRIFLAGATGAIGSPPRPPPPRRRPRGHRHDPQRRQGRRAARGRRRAGRRRRPRPRRRRRRRHRRAPRRRRPPAHRPGRPVATCGTSTPCSRPTNRLRTEGTEHLLAGARAAGARRFVAQSYTGWPYGRTGGAGEDRGRPARPGPARRRCASRSPPSARSRRSSRARPTSRGSRCATAGSTARARASRPGGEQLEMVRKRKIPIVGDGAGLWSFVHIDDAAAATLAAIERGAPRRLQRRATTSPPPCATGCPGSPRSSAPSRRATCRAGSAGLAAGEAAHHDDDRERAARRTRRRARSSAGARLPDWREGFRATAARRDLGEPALEDRLQREAVVLPGHGLLQPQARRRPSSSRKQTWLSKNGPSCEAPAHRRVADAGGRAPAAARPACRPRCTRSGSCAARASSSGLRNGEHVAW